MRQIRNRVFETNSSSTHSICISKEPVTFSTYPLIFHIGEYGWENTCIDDTASYLYTAILDGYEYNDAMTKLEVLKDILDNYGIEYEFDEPKWHICDDGDRWLTEGYLDHASEAHDFVETVLNDDDMLMRYLFGNSFIYTGNDNQDDIPSGCDIANEEFYDYDAHEYVSNPYHNTEHYDYFYKGN